MDPKKCLKISNIDFGSMTKIYLSDKTDFDKLSSNSSFVFEENETKLYISLVNDVAYIFVDGSLESSTENRLALIETAKKITSNIIKQLSAEEIANLEVYSIEEYLLKNKIDYDIDLLHLIREILRGQINKEHNYFDVETKYMVDLKQLAIKIKNDKRYLDSKTEQEKIMLVRLYLIENKIEGMHGNTKNELKAMINIV